jgi:hypothetical protein
LALTAGVGVAGRAAVGAAIAVIRSRCSGSAAVHDEHALFGLPLSNGRANSKIVIKSLFLLILTPHLQTKTALMRRFLPSSEG